MATISRQMVDWTLIHVIQFMSIVLMDMALLLQLKTMAMVIDRDPIFSGQLLTLMAIHTPTIIDNWLCYPTGSILMANQ